MILGIGAQVWAKSVDPDQRILEDQSDQGLHCLPFCLHLLHSLLYMYVKTSLFKILAYHSYKHFLQLSDFLCLQYPKTLKFWTPEKVAVITLKAEQGGFTIEWWVQKMQTELQIV